MARRSQMVSARATFVAALVWFSAAWGAFVCAAPTPGEQRAFNAAMQSFQGGWWEIADRQFAEFLGKYPKSELVPEAILRRAQARFRLRKFGDAIELLTGNRDRAGPIIDEWLFWLGEAYFASSNYAGAAEAYGSVARNFPNSARAAVAAYHEALAYAKIGDWAHVERLLEMPAGPLERAIASNPTNDVAINSRLLLAEAQLRTGSLTEAEKQLAQLGTLRLAPCTEWRRLYLLGSVLVRRAKLEEALAIATNLVAAADACGRDELKAETVLFKAGVLEHAARFDEAYREYEKLFGQHVPVGARKSALLRAVGLNLRQGKVDAAATLLDDQIVRDPYLRGSDAALLALGELRLKQFAAAVARESAKSGQAAAADTTNLLRQAMALFDAVVTNAADSPFVGRAWLGKGWCLWLTGNVAESVPAFESAAKLLQFSEEQAQARFKLADAQFAAGEFAAALTNYQVLVADYGRLPGARQSLIEPALYQAVRAALAVNDLAAATNAMHMILREFPNGFRAQSVLLVAGQDIAAQGRLSVARQFFAEFERRYPDSPLLPEVKLALARTFEQENNWIEAVKIYEEWVTNYARLDLLPQVEYRRGWANYKAGMETNALAVFVSIVTRFPTAPVAPLAQNWIADFYFRRGDYKRAEENYQLLYQRWAESELAYEARMMAGRAAMASLRFSDAISYFTNLINDPNCPSNLSAQALFAFGDALVQQAPAEVNRPLANYEEAIRVFSRLQRLYPGTELATLAGGRIGDCYLQLASQNPNYLTNAFIAYRSVVDDPRARASARSQAEVGLGLVLDKQAEFVPPEDQARMRQRALEHYLRVVYQQNLREGEQPDTFWIKEAGLRAVRLAEELQMWEQLAKDGGICDYLGTVLPQNAQFFEARKARAKARMAALAR
ncbi:MAG: tetratricopeptide repeat protein [Verrucomicrobiae bacterium]|nr:tetratricopeptide repeat protein [Verrucomicrobiae bacterium]